MDTNVIQNIMGEIMTTFMQCIHGYECPWKCNISPEWVRQMKESIAKQARDDIKALSALIQGEN